MIGLLGVALAAVRQLLALAVEPLDDALDDLLGDLHGPRRGGGRDQRLDGVVLVVLLVGDQRGVERLRQLGAVAVERVGLERQLPGQHVGALAVLDRRVVRHVDGLGDGARDEGLGRRHHADVALDREVALADLAAGVGAVEHRQVLVLEEGRAFERHRAADMDVGGLDVLLGEAERRQHVEGEVVELLVGEAEASSLQEVGAQRPLVEDELDVEGATSARR